MHVRTGLHGRRHLVQDGLLRHLDRRELLIEGLWRIVIACGFRRPPKLPNLIGVAQAIDQQALRLQDPFDREVFLSVDPAATAKSLVVARQDPDQILTAHADDLWISARRGGSVHTEDGLRHQVRTLSS